MKAPLRVSALACTASLLALGAGAFGLVRPEPLIERSFADAFDRMEVAPPLGSASDAASRIDPSFIHLSRLAASQSSMPSLAVGDSITLALQAGGSSTYEVIELRPLSGASLGEGAANLPRLMMITAATTGRLPAQTIRFIVDADAPAGPVVPAKPHAL